LSSTFRSGQFDDPDDLWIVYDGQCPFCSQFVTMYRLRENGYRVHLIDARSDHSLVDAICREGLDLNEGMVVRWLGRTHYGHDAMTLLAKLESEQTLFNRAYRSIFRHPRLARVLYPGLVMGRKLTLRALGRGLIRR
jgi:predicted DCC family thiol-disulfide oxidoreductase YuxK